MSTSTKKAIKDIQGDWVDLDILGTISTFVREHVLDQTFTNVGPTVDKKVFPPDGHKRIFFQYNVCVIPFHEFLFSFLGYQLSFNEFEVNVLNQLLIALHNYI